MSMKPKTIGAEGCLYRLRHLFSLCLSCAFCLTPSLTSAQHNNFKVISRGPWTWDDRAGSSIVTSYLLETPQDFTTHTYQAVQGNFTWHQAKADAEARGGHLATITSQAEFDYILALGVLPEQGGYFLGATDEMNEGVWVWVTGEPFVFNRWSSGEPNNSGPENYLIGDRAIDHTWNDIIGLATPTIPWYLLEIESPPCSPHTAQATPQLVNGFVVAATILDHGCGYTSDPPVVIIGGGGNGAKAKAAVSNGVVVRITITDAGIGYISTPTLLIAPPPMPPRRATATSLIGNGSIVGITVMDMGNGYDAAPVVLLRGGGGSGATAVATVINGVVTGITITNPGSGYTSAPSVLIGSPPFLPELTMEVSKVRTHMKLVLGRRYQLESTTNLTTWAPAGDPFLAEDEILVREFDVDTAGRYFRIKQVP